MRNRLGITLGLALALGIVLTTAAGAEFRLRKGLSNPLLRGQTFVLAGRVSGPIANEIRIDETTYMVAPDAQIYEIGRGIVPSGTSYYDRIVSVTGIKVRGTLVVTGVTVRPYSYPGSGTVGIQDASSPK